MFFFETIRYIASKKELTVSLYVLILICNTFTFPDKNG